MRILVVDDMASMRQVMITMLKSLGYRQIDEAPNGAKALKFLNSRHYDLLSPIIICLK